MIDFTVVLFPNDESGCKFIGSSELVQLLMTFLTLVGTIIRCEDLYRMLGQLLRRKRASE
jgi:hypothetical protein